jgi:D-beta-D-heptose 7-phosphate kinase / D-beta-D-heptose 1-phosphate adenosyltransferase
MRSAPMTDESGVVHQVEFARRARCARKEGQKIVLTNGCFDILHLGHVIYLREARSLGDVLFVAVNSDRSAQRLKGPKRPYNSDTDRAGVVAALASVLAVTIFDEDTASNIVAEVRPDVYAKGGDYSSDPDSPAFPIEGRVVSGYGGEVRIVPFAAGYSTTRLIKRIKDGDDAGSCSPFI